MIVECENCRSKFNVDPDLVKDAGSKVRCSKCKHIFLIYKPAPEEVPTTEPFPDENSDSTQTASEEKSQEEATGLAGFDISESESQVPGLFETDEELDFSALDDELGLDEEEPVREQAAALESVPPAEDLDLGELAEDLDLPEEESLDFGPETQGEPTEDELDLGTLDADLGLDEEGVEERILEEETETEEDFFKEEELLGFGEEDRGGPMPAADGPGEDLFEGLDFKEEEPGASEVEGVLGQEEEEALGFEEHEEDLGPGPDSLAADKEMPAVEDEDDLFAAEAEEEFPAMEGEEEDLAAEFAVPAKRHGFLWVIIGFLVLVVAGAGVWFFAPGLLAPLGLQPPSATEVKDDPMGKRLISPENAKHSFQRNETEGQLLIITGLARNHYKTPRSFLRLKGLLHDSQGKILAQQVVFCGNVLSEDELRALPVDEISKRLKVRGGDKGANMKVPPTKSVPFMIVFNNIPAELAEYTVEAFGSEPAE